MDPLRIVENLSEPCSITDVEGQDFGDPDLMTEDEAMPVDMMFPVVRTLRHAKEQLSAQESFLGALPGAWFWECDADGTLTSATSHAGPELEKLTTALIGKSMGKAASAELSRQPRFHGAGAGNVDCLVRLSSSFAGSTWTRMVGSHDADGSYRGAAFDVTDEIEPVVWSKVTKEALAEGTRRQRAIFDGTFGLMIVLTAEGLMLEVNQTVCDLFGVERTQLVGLTLMVSQIGKNNPEFTAIVTRHVSRDDGPPLVREQTTVTLADGLTRVLDVSLKIGAPHQGHENFIILDARDITESKVA
jgi:PAS domain S-box-containing protein